MLKVTILALFTALSRISAATQFQGWYYYVRESSMLPFNLVGDLPVIRSILKHTSSKKIASTDSTEQIIAEILSPSVSLFEGNPLDRVLSSSQAIINEKLLLQQRTTIVFASFQVQVNETKEFIKRALEWMVLPDGKPRHPSVFGFSKGLMRKPPTGDPVGVITFLLTKEHSVRIIEAWTGQKCALVEKAAVTQYFLGLDKAPLTSNWKVIMEDKQAGLKTVAEVSNLLRVKRPLNLMLLHENLERASHVLERGDFAEYKSHDRFVIEVTRSFGPQLFNFAVDALHHNKEFLGSMPWVGLEKATKIKLEWMSKEISKFSIFFRPNAVDKVDVQRVFSGLPYGSLLERAFFTGTERILPKFKVDCCYGIDSNIQTSALVTSQDCSVRLSAVASFSGKRARDQTYSIQFIQPDFVPAGGDSLIVLSVIFPRTNLVHFIYRFWHGFLNNKNIPAYVNYITYSSIQKATQPAGTNVLVLHLPREHASEDLYVKLELLLYLFFRFCGIESGPPRRFVNFEPEDGDQELKVFVADINLEDRARDLDHINFRWFQVRCQDDANDWTCTGSNRGRGRSKKKESTAILIETEITVDVQVPGPLKLKKETPPEYHPAESSWDHFFNELDD